jgi:hypothetical protein
VTFEVFRALPRVVGHDIDADQPGALIRRPLGDAFDFPQLSAGHAQAEALRLINGKGIGEGVAHALQEVSSDPEAGALVAVVEGMSLSDAPQEHGSLLKGTWVRVLTGVRLEGGAHDLLDQPLLTDRPHAAAEVGHSQDVEVHRGSGKEANLGDGRFGVGRGEVDWFGEDQFEPAEQLGQGRIGVVGHTAGRRAYRFASRFISSRTSARFTNSR